MKKVLLAACLMLLCGCGGIGSMTHGSLDMERALTQMAQTMREAKVGVMMNETATDTQTLESLYGLELSEEEYALICAIRADVTQEAAIFKCNAQNRSIIETRVNERADAARAQGLPVQTGEKGDYLYIAIGKDAVWMRNYLKGL